MAGLLEKRFAVPDHVIRISNKGCAMQRFDQALQSSLALLQGQRSDSDPPGGRFTNRASCTLTVRGSGALPFNCGAVLALAFTALYLAVTPSDQPPRNRASSKSSMGLSRISIARWARRHPRSLSD